MEVVLRKRVLVFETTYKDHVICVFDKDKYWIIARCFVRIKMKWERPHSCDAPVFSMISSDTTRSLHIWSFSLTCYGRWYIIKKLPNPLNKIVIELNIHYLHDQNMGMNFAYGWWKAHEQEATFAPGVSKWLEIKLNRVNIGSSTHLVNLCAHYRDPRVAYSHDKLITNN